MGNGGPLGGAGLGGTDRLRWAGRGAVWGERASAGGGILGDWTYLSGEWVIDEDSGEYGDVHVVELCGTDC